MSAKHGARLRAIRPADNRSAMRRLHLDIARRDEHTEEVREDDLGRRHVVCARCRLHRSLWSRFPCQVSR